MKSYADTTMPTRLALPIVRYYPHEPIPGEILIINSPEEQGVRYYDDELQHWIPLFATTGNIWESQMCTHEQYEFHLENAYNTNGRSIVVYLDGVRLPQHRVVEVSNTSVIIKEIYDEEGIAVKLQEGQLLEFQIFNRELR